MHDYAVSAFLVACVRDVVLSGVCDGDNRLHLRGVSRSQSRDCSDLNKLGHTSSQHLERL
jgi:hypothetical protein